MGRAKDTTKQKIYEAKFVAYLERKKIQTKTIVKHESKRTNK